MFAAIDSKREARWEPADPLPRRQCAEDRLQAPRRGVRSLEGTPPRLSRRGQRDKNQQAPVGCHDIFEILTAYQQGGAFRRVNPVCLGARQL